MGFLFGGPLKKEPCGTPGCLNEIVGLVTKFGETRVDANTPPGMRISIWYCEEHKDKARVHLDAL